VLTNVTPTMKVSCREVFGPVVTVTPYRQFDEALEAMNRSEYGLQAGVFTQDVNKVFYAFRHLEVGAVLVNEIPTFRAEHMPYGGVKDSGLGREGLRISIEEMTEPAAVECIGERSISILRSGDILDTTATLCLENSRQP
jgi:glyceraldehyde-3-phosphate dehydrogenase (NADP+)